MANIILKDKNGANVVYKNVDYVSFQTLEGGTVRFNERAAKIISVTELPTEEIDDNAIYRLTTVADGKTTVEFYAHENSGEWITVAEGAKMSELVVTENGEYTPIGGNDEDGFSKVTVNIDTFTDVDELPVENIDGDAIYRVTTKDADTGSVVIVNDELVTAEAGAFLGRVFNYTVVDELPAISALEAPTTDDAGVITANAYIIRSTGVPHYTVADESGNLFLAEMGLLSEYEFKGALPAEVTESGMYSVINIGTTYTTYGLLDANNTKTVLEFTADEGWVECGNGGNVTPLEITKNGVTYDENTPMDYVGKLEPGSMYVYKQKIDRAAIEELYNNYTEEDGFLYETETPDGKRLPSYVDKIGNEYMLSNNVCMNACQAYCTGTIFDDYTGKFLYEGWNIIGALNDTPPTRVGDDMRVVLYTPPKTGEGTGDLDGEFEYCEESGLWKFYEEHLLAKKVDTDNLYTITPVGEDFVGTFKGVEVGAVDFGLTIDQMKEIPLIECGNYEANTVYQFLMMTEVGRKFLLGMSGATQEVIDSYKNMYETDAYFCFDMLELVIVYVKDLAAAGHEDLVGEFENGHWYMSSIPIDMAFLTYQKSTFDAFNPVVVNIPNADTIVEVEELPTTGVESDKIYKKVDRGAPKYDIMSKAIGTCISYKNVMGAVGGIHIEIFGVEALPSTFIQSTESELYLYIVLPTGEVYISEDGVTAVDNSELIGSSFKTEEFGGTVEDPNYIPESDNVSYFFLKYYDEVTIYGLPNNGTDKQYYEYNDNTSTWDELDSGDILMAKVDELPSENISNNKVYCVKQESEALLDLVIANVDEEPMPFKTYMELLGSIFGATITVEYHVVDELPENPLISFVGEDENGKPIMTYHIYILSTTGEAYASEDGTTYKSMTEDGTMFGPYLGKISDMSEVEVVTEKSYYTLMRDYSVSYTYGIPMSDNKAVYTHNGTEWILAKNDIEEVTELPTENVIEQTVYKIPGTEESGATIGIVDTDNAKTIMVYKNGTWVRFVEETPAVDPETPTEPAEPTDPETPTDPTTEPTDPEATDPTTDPEATT
jgi:hypothetical protein